MNTMKLAHINAAYGVKQFGGCKADYMAEALRLAHQGINLEKANKRTIGDVLAAGWEAAEIIIIGVVFGALFSVIGLSMVVSSLFSGFGFVAIGLVVLGLFSHLGYDFYKSTMIQRLNDRRIRLNRMAMKLAA